MTAQIAGNTVYSTGDRGIYARGGAATIANNTLHDIGGDGIRTDSTNTDVVIRANTLTTVQGDGIEAQGQRITLTDNRVTGAVDNALKADNVGTWVAFAANVGLDSGTGLVVRNAPVFHADEQPPRRECDGRAGNRRGGRQSDRDAALSRTTHW